MLIGTNYHSSDTVYGGTNVLYHYKWLASERKNESATFLDLNSEYAAAIRDSNVPCGPYKIFLDEEINSVLQISSDDGSIVQKNGCEPYGLIKVKIELKRTYDNNFPRDQLFQNQNKF